MQPNTEHPPRLAVLPSRIEAAHRGHARASELVLRLAADLDAAFSQLEAANERMIEEGVRAELDLPDWMNAARAGWRTERSYVEPAWRSSSYTAALPIAEPRD